MSKKKKKITVYGIVEGVREKAFIDALLSTLALQEQNFSIKWEGATGGAPDKFVIATLKECYRNKTFALFDEDYEPHDPLTREARVTLSKSWNVKDADLPTFLSTPLRDLQRLFNGQNRNPTLIVCNPVCVESLILKCLNETLPYATYDHSRRKVQINGLKDKLNALIGDSGLTEKGFYLAKLNPQHLAQVAETCLELRLILSIFELTSD